MENTIATCNTLAAEVGVVTYDRLALQMTSILHGPLYFPQMLVLNSKNQTAKANGMYQINTSLFHN